MEGSALTPYLKTVAQKGFDGTATELLECLNGLATEGVQRRRDWPKRANSLSNALRRLAPNLRRVGIEVTFYKPSRDEKKISITAGSTSTTPDGDHPHGGERDKITRSVEQQGKTSSPSSPSSLPQENQGFGGDDHRLQPSSPEDISS